MFSHLEALCHAHRYRGRDSLISSGEIGLIANDELGAALTSWLDRIERLNEEEREDRRMYDQEQLPLVYEFVPNLDVAVRTGYAGVEDYPERSPFEADYRGLLSSRAFENIMEWRASNKLEILSQYENVRSELERIRELVRAELAR